MTDDRQTQLLMRALNLLHDQANEGDRINHAWAYICRYCGECSDTHLEHSADCAYRQLVTDYEGWFLGGVTA